VADDLVTGFSVWKATELIDDYGVLEDGSGFGYVTDLIFDPQGRLRRVVVYASGIGGPGHYGYPWFGYGYRGYAWHPSLDHYVLPYDEDEIARFAAFDYERLGERPG
jgi:hypothetical protein